MTDGTGVNLTAGVYAIGAFISYLVLVTGIGVFSAKFSSAGMSEFFLGGRRMNRFVVALSAVVSGRSSWLLLGVTGMAYKMGAAAVWAVVGYIVAELFLFLYYARRLRNFSGEYDCITLTDFFAARFEDKSGVLRVILVVIIVVFMISYVSAQFVGGGKAFSAGFGLDPAAGILLTAVIVLIYTLLGGFLAVSLTDMLQAIFMILALAVIPILAFADRGGFLAVINELNTIDATLINPLSLSAGVIIGFLGIGLGSPGNPHILVRYMSIDDAEQLRYSAVVATVWNVVMAWGALFIGLAGRVYFPDASMLPSGDTENLYPALAQLHLHPVLFGIVVASIFAAIMSTADSQLLVAASSIVRDLYEKIIRRGQTIPQVKLVLYSRLSIVLLTIAALVMGMAAKKLVFWLVLFAWAGLGAALGPASILALFWKRTTRQGVIAGMITGTFVTLIWYYIPVLKGAMYELVPAFLLSGASTVIVSYLTEKPDSTEIMFEKMLRRSSKP